MVAVSMAAFAQTPVAKPGDVPWSARMADTAMARWPLGNVSGNAAPKWSYEEGTLLQGVSDVWAATADAKYYSYIKQSVDALVAKDGSIATYNAGQNALDDVLMGRMALLMYGTTLDKRYYIAAKAMRAQLDAQPRTNAGGFWHKQRYPHQMWLDGLYMAEPFYAEYAREFQEPKSFDDVALQFELSEKYLRDAKTGLLYHGWDESKKEKWANAATGDSPEFWSRGMGWYAMALVDTLDYFPEDQPQRKELIAILNRLARAVAQQQDAKTGLWYEVMNKPQAKGNYLETSSSAMFAYALAKGARLGYLPLRYQAAAHRAYTGLLAKYIQTDDSGQVHMTQMVASAGLGGTPYRDGSYAYYTGEKVVQDDAKGVGAFLMASTEMEMTKTGFPGRGDTVVMDGWFNSQTRQNAAGQTESFHYKWNDEANSGFSFFGHAFQSNGVKTATLAAAPTAEGLKDAQIYMIVSPDIPSKNPNPHYVQPEDGAAVEAWVRQGGVLVLMMNDVNNTEFTHVNTLAERFGVHFNAVDNNLVPDAKREDDGKLLIPPGNAIFTPKKIFMKEICSITPSGPAHEVLNWQGNTVMAVAKVGKGTVFATVDPWLYNEYTDGRRLNNTDFEQYPAAKELVRWLVKQVPAQTTKEAK